MAKEKYKHNHPLVAHALIQAGGVGLVVGLVPALIEAVLHYTVDKMKICGAISVNQDQWIHYVSKVGYLLWVI